MTENGSDNDRKRGQDFTPPPNISFKVNMIGVDCYICKASHRVMDASIPKEGSEFYYICETCREGPPSSQTVMLQTFQKQLDEIRAENEYLKGEITKLKRQSLSDILAAIVPEIISNIQQQEENSKFMVVAGLPESIDVEGDKEEVRELCKVLGSTNVEKEVTEIFRIGPQSQGRPRLLKVGFVSSSARNNKLKNGKNLKNYRGGKVYIRPSMTRKQRELQKEMIDQAKQGRSEGKSIQVRTDFHGNPYYFDTVNFKKLGGRQATF